MSLKPFVIAGAALFGVGLILFALGGLTPIPLWVGALIAAIGLIAFLVVVKLMAKTKPSTYSDEDYGVPEVGLMAASSRTVKCPRCDTANEVIPGKKPTCSNCGFS